ncbi:MAG: hypothetical protein GY950_37650, partial [bacterium]|nr:hypothetical protein [bacterium]
MKLTERISTLSPAQRKLVLVKLREQGIDIDLSGLPGDTDQKSRGTASGTGLEPVEKKEYYALSSAQKRFYLLQYLETGSIAYNMTGVMVIRGKLHKQRFKEAARKLVTRHEALRTFIDAVEGEPRQRIQPGVEFEIDHYDADAGEGSTEREKIAAVIRDFTRPFDLATAPLLRMGLIKTEEETHIFLFDMHHIISDGTSMSMLVKDFTALYSGMRLPPLRIQYKDFCEWQDHLLTSGKLKKEEKYWLNTFSGDIPLLNMPTDYP